MRRLLTSLLVMMALGPVSGCSLLIDTDPYVGGGSDDGGPDPDPDAGVDPRDGGDRDAMVDPDGPSAPELAIAPEAPRTADDLVASITTESVDPLDAGAITYEWSWQVDGADADETGMTISADRTSKGQVWTVSVTPIASDGRRGAAGTASVTIANSPPTVRYVRLDTYRPIIGDVLLAFSGAMTDPDGDAVGLRYAWYLNDEVIAGQVSNRLDTGDLTIAPGDRIRVSLTSRDPDGDGNTVTAGPAIALADETRWRQLLPHRTWNGPHVIAHDPQNDRVLMLYAAGRDGDDVRVWEYTLDGTGVFTQLFPTGPEPTLGFASPIWDAARQRILFVGGVDDIDGGVLVSDIYVLDVSQRGAETFSVIEPLGAEPPPRVYATAALDAARDRLLFYGGISFEGGEGVPLNDFWSLDLSTVGAETWTEHTIPLPPATIVGGALLVDAPRDRAVLVTGGEYAGGGGDPPPSMSIYTIDLGDLSSGFFAAGTIPDGAGRFFATAGLDAARDRALVGYGIAPDDVVQSDIIEIDLATLAATLVTPAGDDAPTSGGRGFMAEHGDAVLMFTGGAFFDGESRFDLYELDPETDVVTALHRTGEDLPPGLASAAAGGRYRGMTIFGGEDHTRTVRDEVWRFDDGEFMLIDAMPDGLDGTTPGPRSGLVVQPSSAWGSGFSFFGGLSDRETLAPADVWNLDDTTWVHRTLVAGETPPPGRQGAATYRGGCTMLGIIGGSTAGGSLLDDHHRLQCSGDRSCQWEPETLAVLSPRTYATAARLSSAQYVIVYGGRDFSGALSELRAYRDCGTSAPWATPTITGTPPPGRWGHTMVAIEDFSSGAVERQVVFGGSGTTSEYDPLSDAHVLTVVGVMGDPPQLSLRWDPLVVASGANDESITPRVRHMATWDYDEDRMLVYGGVARNEVLSDLWELRYRPAPP